jgi:ribonuclease HI
MSNSYYVVKKGHMTGIYKTWVECKRAVDGFSNPIFRKFDSFDAATNFYNNKDSSSSITPSQSYRAKTTECETGNKHFINNSNANTNTNLTTYLTLEEKQQLEKVKELSQNIKSSHFSPDLNYNFDKWNTINDEIYIFTDGSSRKSNEYFNSGIGVYLGYNCMNIKEQYNNKTNNMCELQAINYAFKLIVKYYSELSNLGKVIKIVSDSEYSIKACSIWLAQWKKNNWKTKGGDDVKNRDLIESIDGSMTRIKLINSNLAEPLKIKVKFIHVNSHQKPDFTDKFKYSIWFGNYIADGLSQNSI